MDLHIRKISLTSERSRERLEAGRSMRKECRCEVMRLGPGEGQHQRRESMVSDR